MKFTNVIESLQNTFFCVFVMVNILMITSLAHADDRADAITLFITVSLPNIAMLEGHIE